MDPNRPARGLPGDVAEHPNDPTHWHATYGRAPSLDASHKPPADGELPDWNSCGKSNCGNHHYPLRDLPLRLGPEVGVSKCIWHCSRCVRPFSLVTLHRLPCSHTLCRDCLGAAAAAVPPAMVAHREEIDELVAQAELLLEFSAQSADVRLAQVAEQRGDDLYLQAQELMGMTCCGRAMTLERFLYCMDPEVAIGCYLAVEQLWTLMDEREYCAWRDCRAYVSVHCAYRCEEDAVEPERMHCLKCSGNSRGHGDRWQPAR